MKFLPAFCVFGAVLCTSGADAASAPGDAWSYRVINAYNGEVRGNVRFRVEKSDADRVALAVTPDQPALGTARTDVYTARGLGVRQPLINHDMPVEYEFAEPYPAYDFPLDAGKSWSTRVNATIPASGRKASVRVDGSVLGTERITVPAGVFDTVKIGRRIYAGDFEGGRSETNIVETEWYAPSLGRAVKLDRSSSYMDQQRCSDEMSPCRPVRGDWFVYELVDAGAR